PTRLSSMPAAVASAPGLPTFSTSAQATPSGYGRSELVTSARRSGMEYITPRMPPSAQMANEAQYGKPVHQPMITRPGSTKMIDDSVPAAEATVCTMLFSWMVAPLKLRSSAIEITAAGMDVANVRPAFRPKNTLAAVKARVMTTPSTRARRVNSLRGARPGVAGWDTVRDPRRKADARSAGWPENRGQPYAGPCPKSSRGGPSGAARVCSRH